ncbi:hypothetical protein BH11MYX2_BH11MYX2_15250 [soil metagenome]
MFVRALIALSFVAACSGGESPARAREVPTPTTIALARHAALPRAPGAFSPSFVAITDTAPHEKDAPTTGEMLADVDSCATCHPDVAKQWSSSAHSFASFGNPTYRESIERLRHDLGKPASQHCGGCHDMPLMVDGALTADAPVPSDDLRAHSGVTCRLCHGVQSTTLDGNGSYVWSATPLDAPTLGDAASIARHKQQVTTKVDTQLCIGCHRGFLSPDLGVPAHVSGIDDTGSWLASPYTKNGMARVDNVELKTCIDCHMDRVPSSADELGAKHGTVASHRFVGGHTWMASMRGDTEQMRLTQAKLEGVASIDVAGARVITGRAERDINGAVGTPSEWYLPAETTPITAGTRVEMDVVIRNLLAGHRFPGGVLDVQDTWIELDVRDKRGERIASSGLHHDTDPDDRDTHVLRSLMVDEQGNVLREHEMSQFRTPVVTHTLAAREARAIRYALEVPAALRPEQLPLVVTARLRHRSRSLSMQAAACTAARSDEGKKFLAGAKGARDVTLDPCAPQPITLISSTTIELGKGAHVSPRPAWEREYEHGMALVASVLLRLDEANAVLSRAFADAPDERSRAMIETQLAWVDAKQGRLAVARERVARIETTLGARPAVLDAILAEGAIRLTDWKAAVVPAEACTKSAPKNLAAWAVYARVLYSNGRFDDALVAAVSGLALSPRDPDLLRTQAATLGALQDPGARAAQDAFDRYKAIDEAAGLRVRCARGSEHCWRDRNQIATIDLTATHR